MLKKIKRRLRFLLGIKSDTDYYSQAGEDAILSKTFSYILPTAKGIYIDVGAYHPVKHSNTYLLYKRGWRGLNIDPRPSSKKLFDRHRSRDINIEAGIAVEDGKMTFYILEEDSTMNSFSRENLERLGVFGRVKKSLEIPVFSINSVLARHPEIRYIDYLNIDAEGFEMQILEGLDFENFGPKVISIEQNDVLTLADVLKTRVCTFLSGKGYVAFAKNVLLSNVSTVFYMKKQI